MEWSRFRTSPFDTTFRSFITEISLAPEKGKAPSRFKDGGVRTEFLDSSGVESVGAEQPSPDACAMTIILLFLP